MENDLLNQVLDEIFDERKRQDQKWGIQKHGAYKWLAIIMEELGEASEAALEADACNLSPEEYENELLQTAASCVAAIECSRRARKV